MIRRIAIGATATALAFGGLGLVAPSAAAKKPPPFDATGTVNCSIAGKVKIKPALTDNNTLPSTTTAKLKGFCSGTTGNSLVTPSKIKAVAVSVGVDPGTCSALITPGTAPWTVTIKWKASGGKINPSTVTFAGIVPAGIGFDLSNGNTVGSYAGTANADAHANLDPAGLDFSKCADTVKPNGKVKSAKGIKKLVVTSGTFSIVS